jgi:hypothetical protein
MLCRMEYIDQKTEYTDLLIFELAGYMQYVWYNIFIFNYGSNSDSWFKLLCCLGRLIILLIATTPEKVIVYG